MDFEIKNVLQKANIKKFAVPAVLFTAGLVFIVYVAKKGSGDSTSQGSGALIQQSEKEDNNDAIQALGQQINTQLLQTTNRISDIQKENQDSITALEKSVADIFIDEKKLNQEQIKNLQTQLVSYQDSSQKSLSTYFDELTKKVSEISTSQLLYRPTPTSYPIAPSVSGGGSYDSVPVATPTPALAPETKSNPYNINPDTLTFEYGGVSYKDYTGADDQRGSAEESAYWNNFINS